MARQSQGSATEVGKRISDFDPTVRMSTEAERREAALRPTGQERFDALTTEEQDAAYGLEIAQALRQGDLTLADLVDRSPIENGPNFITTKPTDQLPTG